MRLVYKILEIREDKAVVFQELKTGKTLTRKIIIPSFAKVGDLIRLVEHHFYDVIDENGEIIWEDKN